MILTNSKNFIKEAGFDVKLRLVDNPSNPEKSVFAHYLLSLLPSTGATPSHISPVGPPWTNQEIADAIAKICKDKWEVRPDRSVGGERFACVAEKKTRILSGPILVCDIESNELTVKRVDNFFEKVTQARNAMPKISVALLFCDKAVPADLVEYFRRKAEEPNYKGLLSHLISYQSDLEAVKEELKKIGYL